jgi:hypothetical protein
MNGWSKVTPVLREFLALQVEQNVEKGDYILICPSVNGSKQRVVSAAAFAANFTETGNLQDVPAVAAAVAEPEEAAYLDEHCASKLLSISSSKLQKMRSRGIGPRFSKVGKLVRYLRQDLIDFMESAPIVVNPKIKNRNAHGERIATFRQALRVLHKLEVEGGSPEFRGVTARALVESGLANTVLKDAKYPINRACSILKTMVDRGFARRHRKSVRDYFHYAPTE